MAITFVSSGEQTTTNDATPLTYTVDIGTRTNGLLVVFVGTVDTITHTQSNPTWNGVAMGTAANQISETVTSTTFQRLAIYYLANPANGSNTFSVDYDDSGTDQPAIAYIVAAWFDGAHQTQASILDQFDDDTGSTDPSIPITPGTNNQLVVAMYASEADAVLTAAHTNIQNQDHGTRTMGTQYVIQTTATTSTMSWAGVDSNWVAVAASFKESASASQTVNANFISSGETLYQPAITTGSVTVSPNLISSVATVYQPAITTGGVTVSPNLIGSAEVVYQPAVINGLTILANLISSVATVYQPSITTGSVTVSPNLITSTATVYQPTVSTTGLTVLPNLITSAAVVYQPSITTGVVTVAPNLIGSAATVYAPAVSSGPTQTVSADFIASGSIVYQVIVALFIFNPRRTLTIDAVNRVYVVRRAVATP